MNGESNVVPPANGNGGASSWRDVYTLVQDVERRLSQRMEEIAGAAKTTAGDHEVRIRLLEQAEIGRTGGDRRARNVDDIVRGWLSVGVLAIAALIGFLAYVNKP